MAAATAVPTVVPFRRHPAAMRATMQVTVSRCATQCSACNLRGLCLPCGLNNADMERVGELVYMRRRLKRGDNLFRSGEPFKYLFAVRSGFLKSFMITEDGREQVTGFQMAGEIIGMDGIETEHHQVNVVALEDCELCIIPFSRLEEASSQMPNFQRQFHRMMSREIVRDQGVMMLLGTMRAEERVAAFLLNMSERFVARGYAAAEFYLRMTREEIGSYLGLKLETVSRIFSRFHDLGLIGIRQRHVCILDVVGLRSVMGQVAQ